MKKVVFDSTVPVPKTKKQGRRLRALAKSFKRHLRQESDDTARAYNQVIQNDQDTVQTFRPPPGVKQSVTKSLKAMGLLGDRTMAAH